jgi:hypothetical protein
MRKEKNEEMILEIKSFPSVAKRIANEFLKEGKKPKDVIRELNTFVFIERNIKSKWFKTLIDQMKDKRFPGVAGDLYEEIIGKIRMEVNFKALKS